jgi:hypothetical protein
MTHDGRTDLSAFAPKNVKQISATGVYITVTRLSSYKSGGAGVFFSRGVESRCPLAVGKQLGVELSGMDVAATKIAKSCNSRQASVLA